MLAQTLDLGKISFSVLSFWYYHILFYTKCDYQIKNSKFQEFLVFWFLSFVFLTNWMSRFQESNSLIRNSQFLNFSYLGILEFAMNVGFSQNGFSANKIPSFQNPSFVIPIKTFLVLSFPVSCVNPPNKIRKVSNFDNCLAEMTMSRSGSSRCRGEFSSGHATPI